MSKNFKTLMLVAAVAALSGCGGASRLTAHWTGYDKTCVDGVTYLQFPSGVTEQRNREGGVVPC